MESTSWNQIAAAAAGSAPARTEFARRYGPLIRDQLEQRWKRTPLREQIDDAVQEVFVELLKPGGVLAGADPSSPAGFRRLLGAVVRNVASRVETRAARRHRLELGTAAEEPAAPHSSMAQRLDREWASALVREAAEEQERRAAGIGAKALLRLRLLRLLFDEGRSIAEVAELWKLPAAHLHHQYAKARLDFTRALRTVLERRFPDEPLEAIEARARQLVELLRIR